MGGGGRLVDAKRVEEVEGLYSTGLDWLDYYFGLSSASSSDMMCVWAFLYLEGI
jgi:hypothetical protein